MKYMITNSQAILRNAPGKSGKKVGAIPRGTVVELLEIVPNIRYLKLVDTVWLKIKHYDIVSYSYGAVFDPYINPLPQDIVDLENIQTKSKRDAKQFVVIDGKTKRNMCGQLSVAYITGLKLSEVLEKWKQEKPGLVKRIWSGNIDRGTSAQVLTNLLETLGLKAKTLSHHLRDPLLKRDIFTMQRLATLLDENHIILGVKINRSGYLGGNINHWVVLDSIEQYGEFGFVIFYNPFNNNYQMASFAELGNNMAGIDGIVVPSKREPMNWLDSLEVPAPDVIETVLPHPEPIEPVVEYGAAFSDAKKLGLLWKEFVQVLSIRNHLDKNQD